MSIYLKFYEMYLDRSGLFDIQITTYEYLISIKTRSLVVIIVVPRQ